MNRLFRLNAALTLGVVLIATIAGTAQIALAQIDSTNWNRFRGPNGDGVAVKSSIPSEFGPEKNLIWKTEIPTGYSSPVIHDGRIFLTAESDGNLFTICLNQADGKERWRKQAPRPRQEKIDGRNHPASASAVVTDDQVFVFFPDYGMLAYSNDGEEKWRQPLGPFSNLYGMGASPIVAGENVVLVCDQNLNSFIIAFDQATGEVAWKTKRDVATSGHCSPVLYQPDPDKPVQILVGGSFNFTSYDSASGKKLWWVGGLCFEMKATPVLTADTAYINGFGSPQNQPDQNFEIAQFEAVITERDADSDGELSMQELPDALARNFFGAVDLDANQKLNESEWNYYRASLASKNSMMAIRLGGEGDMTRENTRWKYHKNIPQLPSPLLIGDQLVMISDRGVVTSLDPDSGIEQYKSRIPGGTGSYYASPVAAGNKIIFANTAGKISVVAAGEKLEVLSVNNLDEAIFATPAIVGDRVYVRTNKALYCFGESTKK